jgi:hypothetical protein
VWEAGAKKQQVQVREAGVDGVEIFLGTGRNKERALENANRSEGLEGAGRGRKQQVPGRKDMEMVRKTARTGTGRIQREGL